jgi:uncharacterized protein YuzE
MRSVMAAPDWRVRYDRSSDVLYVSKRPGVPARSREREPGVIWRYDVQRGDLIGVTVIDFATYWGGNRRSELIHLIASRFALSDQAAREMLDSIGQ